MSEEKTIGQELETQLGYKTKNAWEEVSDDFVSKAFQFCEGYKEFLDKAKTEREFVEHAEKLALQKGFKPLNDFLSSKKKLVPGTKVYEIIKKKAVLFSVIGSNSMENGVNLVGAHIDSPRIDIKQNPLYEDINLAYLKTHYYGGIKKYQWLTIPLALHGVIIKNNGEVVNINIGEDNSDPVFTITDLLPHLAKDQMQKKLMEAIPGEDLNILFGSIPYKDEKIKEKAKLNILKLLNEKYGIVEEDFISAELEIVPAFKAKDVGLDRSMVGAYGQDDRVCAYPALYSIIEAEKFDKTAICVLADKEEIGSVGNTGSQSVFLENFIAKICSLTTDNYSDIILRKCLENSKMLSADVNGAVDPSFKNVNESKNAAYLGKGIVLSKFTGSRGKSGASDANAEFVAEVRKIFNDNSIIWHMAELGKVDQGGGGTIAQFIANLGVDVIDCGVPVLSMHAPFEVTSKIDIYMSYNAYKVFLKNMN